MVSPCSSHNTMAAKEAHAQPRAQPVQPHQKQEQSIEQVAGAPSPAFCITERWIRERLNLQMSSLDSIRSLALPGSYSEKITHLGRSLVGFNRLKHLDLSRNAIESLQGLEQLKLLESLNLYYNNVSSLKDLFLLRYNSKLKELDLRLNPVTHHEPDYRLFLIHMLIHLSKLDERGVVDSERRAALMHFSTDQAHQMMDGTQNCHLVAVTSSEYTKQLKPRTEMVQSLAPSYALQDNTDELLELIRRSDCLVTPVKHSTSTSAHQTPHISYKNCTSDTPSRSVGCSERSAKKESVGMRPVYQDEAEAYSDFKVNVNFTPAPQASSECMVTPVSRDEGKQKHSEGVVTPVTQQRGDEGRQKQMGTTDDGISSTISTNLVDLLQQYIPTDVSFLTRDVRFKDALSKLWKHCSQKKICDREIQKLRDEVTTLKQQLVAEQTALRSRDTELACLQEALSQRENEVSALSGQLSSELEKMQEDAGRKEEMTQLLQHANDDISSLQQHVHNLQEENAKLKMTLDKAPKTEHLVKLKEKIEQLKSERETLISSIQGEKHKVTHDHMQLQELNSMLKESHRSLLATNDHLLRELEGVKLKHSQEIAQMHQNYQHLKKTLSIVHAL